MTEMTRFIDTYRDRFGVEPIPGALQVSASTQYHRRTGAQSVRAMEDEQLLAVMLKTHENFQGWIYRKVWKTLRLAGDTAQHCQVQRAAAVMSAGSGRRRWPRSRRTGSCRRPRATPQPVPSSASWRWMSTLSTERLSSLVQHQSDKSETILLPLGVNVVAGVLLAIGGVVVSKLASFSIWIPLGLAAAVVGITTFFTRKRIRRRYLMLKIFKEVSSSRRGEYFVELARRAFAELPVETALTRLSWVVTYRRYPNLRFLDDLRDLLATNGDRASATRYLQRVLDARHVGRIEVANVLAEFVAGLPAQSQLVLYGYSSTVCEGLARVGELEHHVFLVEDLQYGVDGSLGEHALAEQRLIRAGIQPTLLKFDQIAPLRSAGTDFVRSSAGKLIPLSKQRRVVAIIGCEAASVDGAILIPSQVRGSPSETAKFIEVFRQAGRDDYIPATVVVVGESYKVFRRFDSSSGLSHAPVRPSLWRDALFVFGMDRLCKGLPIELVRLDPSDVDTFIDEAGPHGGGDQLNLAASFDLWHRRAVIGSPQRGQPMLADALLAAAKCVVFDLNGVLMDDEPAHYAAFADVLRTRGQTLSYEEYLRDCSGRTDAEGFANLSRNKHIALEVGSMVTEKRSSYARHRNEFLSMQMPGAVAVALKLAQSETPCYLVTSCDEDTAQAFLASCGLADVFAGRSFFEIDSGAREPIYRQIAAAAKCKPAECVLIDDSPRNLRRASRVGLMTIGVTTTHDPAQMTADVVLLGPLGSEG